MRSRLPKTMIALALVTVAALAVACGDDDDGGTATPEATQSPTATRLPGAPTPSPTPPPATTEAGMELREFVIAPDRTRARPGTVIFKVRNAGELTHQFLVIRSDLPIAELPRKPGNAGVDETQLEVVGRIEAIAPGDNGEVTVPVELGNYVLICNLFADGKSHYLTGMYNSFEVTLTAPDPQATPQPTIGVTLVPTPTP
ncbi:MAG TPA: hypothetical protein VFP63_00695 [Dehalococcoidia bacterium]|nr:hypothetical protein [Dehalococcoidia bacterium]